MELLHLFKSLPLVAGALIIGSELMKNHSKSNEPSRSLKKNTHGALGYSKSEMKHRVIRKNLENALRFEKGTGCFVPYLNMYADEIMAYNVPQSKITCPGEKDWVKCYISKCRVIPEILKKNIYTKCQYQDLMYKNDKIDYVSKNVTVLYADEVYKLKRSDHVKIKCYGVRKYTRAAKVWEGVATGFRPVTPKRSPAGRKNTINVLLFAFDATSRLSFMRKMPKSYKFLKNELEATFLTNYNVIGDGTTIQLFAILTGKTELEHPDARTRIPGTTWLNHTEFIFHKLRQDGYRTAYFEDWAVGTFQLRLNGFSKRPADHYLKAFDHEVEKARQQRKTRRFCVGDTPQYKVMMNLTEQFFKLKGKKFCFTFVADISHDDNNKLAAADDDLVQFLSKFRDDGHLENTLLFVMADHGARYPTPLRMSYQGKLEHRLPLMSVVLPRRLVREWPDAAAALTANAQVLTTPHDIHATILDAVNLPQYMNKYKGRGTDFYRGLSLLKPISPKRSCSEAGVVPHWCACFTWSPVKAGNPIYYAAATALLNYINKLTEPFRDKCRKLELLTISYVKQGEPNDYLLGFQHGMHDGYGAVFLKDLRKTKGMVKTTLGYKIKIMVSPSLATYEAAITYLNTKKKFVINARDISYRNSHPQPECISNLFPHLKNYCYCRN